MFRTLPPFRTAALAGAALLLTTAAALAGDPAHAPDSNYSRECYPPSYYGYNLDAPHPGYYGGINYREYYNYGRGWGIANFPMPYPSHLRPEGIPLQRRCPPPAPPEAAPVPVIRGVPGPEDDSVASFQVRCPEGAEVWLEGVKTKQEGPARSFVSPSLEPGKNYSYQIRARWTEDGRPVEQTQNVIVHRGERFDVAFPMAPDTDLQRVPETTGKKP